MKRVTGIGGVFFKSKDPQKSKEWYQKHLGFNTDEWGATFWWKNKEGADCSTQWSPFKDDTSYFEPSKKDFMFNYRVENLELLLNMLRLEGVEIVGKMEEYDYGKFAWILDNEGNKIELWEPKDQVFK
ncbi:MAG: glyoxalase [Flavobacteriaceae bacterium]|nr:glyoxalase [Flavobacteriaceae bacterium]|tara:strand:+ start:330082 stop:330465 length:384 start_codon:yes stop_codon:yes gene_type:complete